MNVLVVGSGGREHAIAWKIAQSREVAKVYVAPGNAGTSLEERVENVPISATDIEGLLDFAGKEKVGLTIVGPEAPLVAGITDVFRDAGMSCFGPTSAAAQLEGSKRFAKEFLARHKIPSAAFRTSWASSWSAARTVNQNELASPAIFRLRFRPGMEISAARAAPAPNIAASKAGRRIRGPVNGNLLSR